MLVYFYFMQNTKLLLIGSDSDEYGCIGSAGFSWCEVLGQCVQRWVTPCQKNELELIEG